MLKSTAYDGNYYREHKDAGLDYLGFGEWHADYGQWFVESLELKERTVLDVGCACGAIMRGIGGAGAFIQGVDLSEHMVKLSREQWPDMAPIINVCDATNLHLFKDSQFYCIHSNNVAEHWRPELVPFILREMRRVTQAGGIMFMAFDSAESTAGRDMSKEDPTHVCIRPLRWWIEKARQAGWEVDDSIMEKMKAHPKDFINRYKWGVITCVNPTPAYLDSKNSGVCLVTLADAKQQQLAAITFPNKERYARRHGYSFVSHNDTLCLERPTAWSKILAIRQALANHHTVMWSDADTLIVDPMMKLDRWLYDEDVDVVVCAENGSNGMLHANSGVILLRNRDSVITLLSDWWNQTKHGGFDGGPWDQPHLLELLRSGSTGVRYIIAGDELNAPPSRPGWKFMVHAMGQSMEDKLKFLQSHATA